MHIVLLRVALALYSVGLVHSIVTVLNKKYTLFRASLIAMVAGFLCQTADVFVHRIYGSTAAGHLISDVQQNWTRSAFKHPPALNLPDSPLTTSTKLAALKSLAW